MHRYAACFLTMLVVPFPANGAPHVDARLVGSWHATLPCDEETDSYDCEYGVISAELSVTREGRYRWSIFEDLDRREEDEGTLTQLAGDAFETSDWLDPYSWAEIAYVVDGNTLTLSEVMTDSGMRSPVLRFTRGALGLTAGNAPEPECQPVDLPDGFADSAVFVAGEWKLSWTESSAEEVAAIATRNAALLRAMRTWRRGGEPLILHSAFASTEGDVTDVYLRVSRQKAELVLHQSDGFFDSLMTCTYELPALALKSQDHNGTWSFVTSTGNDRSPLQLVFPKTEHGGAFPE